MELITGLIPTSSSSRRVTVLVHLGFVLTGIITTLLGPLLPTLAARWVVGDMRSGYLFLAQFTGSFIGVILCGRAIPVRSFRFCFVTGFLLIGLGASCLGRGTWIVGLSSVFAYGVGIGFSAGATNLWVSEANPSRRASALSLVNCSWTLGAIAAPLLVAVGDRTRQITLFVAVFAMAAALLALAFAMSTPDRGLPEPAEIISVVSNSPRGRIVRDPFPFGLSLLFFLYIGTESSLSGWSATYAHRLQSSRNDAWALMPSFLWTGLLLGRLIVPGVLQLMTELRLLRAGLVLAGIACCFVLGASRLPTIAGACLIAGLGLAGVFPIAMSWLSKYCGFANYRLAGLVLALGGLGGGVFPWLVGLTSDSLGDLRAGLVLPLLCVILILGLCAFPDLTLPRCRDPKQAVLQK
jgi:FHS family glucose/mannose:H+ symporter-like MFS transporter